MSADGSTDGAFVPNGAFFAEYDGSYLFGDFVCGKIFELKPNGTGGYDSADFASGLGPGGPIALDFGPDRADGEALYYTTFAGGGQVPGQVRCITQTTN